VCSAIKDSYDERLAQIPVIMITGKTGDTDRLVSKAIGASVFITKPFEFGEVLDQIQRLIGA
jgi:DNA-binding response OmpR family regulator